MLAVKNDRNTIKIAHQYASNKQIYSWSIEKYQLFGTGVAAGL
jgi:hypothetical protein